jgi:hypothetical protein
MIFKIAIISLLHLIALIGAVFMYIYVKSKKDSMPKWYSYVAIGFIGLVVLMKIIFVAIAICVICCRHHGGGGEERRMFMMQHEMRMHERDCERECEGDERCSRGKMDCDKECEEACEGKEDKDCCKDKKGCEKDTIVVRKEIKK